MDVDRLFRVHRAALVQQANAMIHDYHRAEEVVQHVFQRLLKRRKPVEFRFSPRAYLRTAVHKEALNAIRERKRRREVISAEFDACPREMVSREDDREEFRRVFQILSSPQQNALMYTVLGGMTVRETARWMGRSARSVEGLLRRAVHRLREYYQLPEEGQAEVRAQALSRVVEAIRAEWMRRNQTQPDVEDLIRRARAFW